MKESTYRLIMMIGLYLGIILFILAIITLTKNIEEIKTDPIIYGMDKHGFDYCNCVMENGIMELYSLAKFKNNEG